MRTKRRQRRSLPDGRRSKTRGTARERLLEAAARVFAEQGFNGASVDDVVAAAGLTKGALYWNFKSKEELFFALVEERIDQPLRALMNRTETASEDEETAAEVSRGISHILTNEAQLVLLMNEYWSLAVRNPKLREPFVERQRSLRATLARALEARHETTGVDLTVPAEGLATAMIALGYGLALDRLADADAVPDELYGEMLGLLYDGLVYRANAAQEGPD